jgi:hypothetical protein
MHADRLELVGMMQRLSAAGDGQSYAASLTSGGGSLEAICKSSALQWTTQQYVKGHG